MKTFIEILEEHDSNDKFAYLGKAEALFALKRNDEANQTISALKAISKSDKTIQDKIALLLQKYK